MEVRELQISDLFDLAEIIIKAGEKAQGKIASAIDKAESTSDKELEGIGLKVIRVLLVDSRDDILRWCGGLCGKNPDDFGKLGMKDLAQFVRALREQEGIGDFLSELRVLIPAKYVSFGSKS